MRTCEKMTDTSMISTITHNNTNHHITKINSTANTHSTSHNSSNSSNSSNNTVISIKVNIHVKNSIIHNHTHTDSNNTSIQNNQIKINHSNNKS